MIVKADTSDGTVLAAGANVLPAATRVFKRRWLMLLLFSSYSMCNAFQWLQYGIISNIAMRFYNVDSFAIDWMSMMSMLTYIVFIFPSIWLLNTSGLRVMAIVATGVNCVGAWIKVGSARPALFWVTALGQFTSSLAQVFILGMPSAIASVWFGSDEVSTASSIGVAGSQVSNIRLLKGADVAQVAPQGNFFSLPLQQAHLCLFPLRKGTSTLTISIKDYTSVFL